jgi:polyhydroxyalkanoate synthesis regulator phasin
MPQHKKKTARRAAPKKPPTTAEALRGRWQAALKSLSSAEAEVEAQWKQLVKKSGLQGKDAGKAIQELRVRLDRERQRAMKGLETGAQRFQERVKEEGAVLSGKANQAMRNALVAFNIPSRQEVAALTRKVDELSRKIDGFRAPARTPAKKKAAARRKRS